jgi:hypothetical protein
MFVQPVLVYEADGAALRRDSERAMSRGVTPAVYTSELFTTNHDEATAPLSPLSPRRISISSESHFVPSVRLSTRSSTGCVSILEFAQVRRNSLRNEASPHALVEQSSPGSQTRSKRSESASLSCPSCRGSSRNGDIDARARSPNL